MNCGGNITQTSEFDPVLCELMYKWLAPENGKIIDPFAGGHVRGTVAGSLGFDYSGVDLSTRQIEENTKKIENLFLTETVHYVNRDSVHIDEIFKGQKFDFLIGCPPYFNLEKYSKAKEDLSNMKWEDFKEKYSEIIKKTCDLLCDDSFACFVVSEVRDKKGVYINFVDFTKDCFLSSGLHFYNEIILLNTASSLALRCGIPFKKSRKVGRQHQNVLIFVKGDPVKATDKLGVIDVNLMIEEAESKYGDVIQPETEN